jgi:hypothetical protein
MDTFELFELPYKSLPFDWIYNWISMQLSPDARYLLYQSVERAAVIGFVTGEPLTEFDTGEWGGDSGIYGITWLSDSSGLVAYTQVNGRPDAVVRIDIQTGEIERLFDVDEGLSFIVID